MNLNPLELESGYRDWWTQFQPNTLALLAGINAAKCFAPRFYVAPSGGNLQQNKQPSGTYLNYVMQIPPGSFIFGIYHGSIQSFTVQVTDLGMNYRWFNTPVPDSIFVEPSDSGPIVLAAPYPVMSPGTFLVEFWSTVPPAGLSTLLSLTFGVAIPIGL